MGLAVGLAVVIEPVLGSFQDRPRDLGGLAEAPFSGTPYYKRRNAAVVPLGKRCARAADCGTRDLNLPWANRASRAD